ncbi:hypothetical protein PSWA111526_12865 [Pseudomonas wadenswilerensis]|jgi:hypothetical protein|uniref:Uncharacterized protein n=1 Tax=Pseudomonas wadenswilerensis TaxID=1785161 RepID=A0A380T126_9PSED|nr:exported protein of unknown function [Pseudomonas sp. JV241A]SUQ63238.1 hypothetical protein CCOS864_02688 [Pseudomonas wadenswilerensis]
MTPPLFAPSFRLAACALGAALSLGGCSHGIESMPLEFSSFTYHDGSYYLRFRSDEEIVSLFKRHTGDGQIGEWLKCALGDDQDFTVGHAMIYNLGGGVDFEGISEIRGYNYVVWARFNKTTPDRSTETALLKPAIHRLLEGKTSIPCKLSITAFAYNAYYSKTMQLPVAQVLSEVAKHRDRLPEWVPDPIVVGRAPLVPLIDPLPLYSDRMQIIDTDTGKPRGYVPYVVKRSDGYLEHGESDFDGLTHEVLSLTRETVKLYVEDPVP